jgi:CheY-like chemotaxis protein
LQQVLLNLCLNARNAMPKGGWIKIDIEQASAEDREVVLTVRDNGEGIPQDALEHIFEPFFTLRPRGQGTGLGMAVVHGIVTDHDGVIDIESEIGEGTCVTVTLPSLSPEYVRQSQTCLPTPTINSMGRVLVVEDNDQIRRLQEIALANKGHTVYAFKYGKRAIEFVHEDGGEFDAIVLDDDLSDMTGTECLKEIKSRQPCIQSVYATGSANFVPPTSDAERGIVIRKPFQMADLADRISELIADRRSQSESL